MSVRRVLIFEPDAAFSTQIREYCERRQLWVVETPSNEEALKLLEKQLFHVCICPINAASDISFIFGVKQLRSRAAVIAAIPSADCSLIVPCMRSGASNIWVRHEGERGFEKVIEETLSRILPEFQTYEEEKFYPFTNFIGRHPRILEIFQLILSIRKSESTILISGESGTGKEVVARAIHDTSPQSRKPFVAVNCGAIPGSLLETELFGHVKGAFTGALQNRIGRFQLAGSGTLFLDEIGDLPIDLQAKILRAIQNKVFEPVGGAHSVSLEARIIAASNQDLERAVGEKKFREDLFYRLNVIPIHIPPLRNRKTDIPLLAKYFLEKFCKVNQKKFLGISSEAMQCLCDYHWPGNVRELENMMERVVVLKRDQGMIELKDLPVQHFRNVKLDRFVANVELPENGLDFNSAVNEFENELILQALQKTSGNKNKAACLLNLNRTTLVEKLKRKGLRIAS